jgi:hypothetical protein
VYLVTLKQDTASMHQNQETLDHSYNGHDNNESFAWQTCKQINLNSKSNFWFLNPRERRLSPSKMNIILFYIVLFHSPIPPILQLQLQDLYSVS